MASTSKRRLLRYALGRRVRNLLNKAVNAVKESRHTPRKDRHSIRKAAVKFRVAKFALYDAIRKNSNVSRKPCSIGRPLALTDVEERTILELALAFSDDEVPMVRKHLEEAVETLIKHLPEPRQERKPFRDGRPGPYFILSFIKCDANTLTYHIPTCSAN